MGLSKLKKKKTRKKETKSKRKYLKRQEKINPEKIGALVKGENKFCSPSGQVLSEVKPFWVIEACLRPSLEVILGTWYHKKYNMYLYLPRSLIAVWPFHSQREIPLALGLGSEQCNSGVGLVGGRQC